MVTEWNWTLRRPHLGNSDYFTSSRVKLTQRFEHLQSLPVKKLTEKHVIKHVLEPIQSKIVF